MNRKSSNATGGGTALAVVAVQAIIMMFTVACGGSKSPAAPSAPSTSPSSTAVYASYDNGVQFDSALSDVAETVFSGSYLMAGWNYGWLTPDNIQGTASAFKFDVQSQIAGRAVAKATLRLYVQFVREDFKITPQIGVSVLDDWSPNTLTWNIWVGLGRQAAGEAQAAAPSDMGAPLDFDVTTIVRNWASGLWSNYGLTVMVNESYPGYTPSNGLTGFQSLETARTQNQRPQLIIDFQ
jgi:hypothetical protein